MPGSEDNNQEVPTTDSQQTDPAVDTVDASSTDENLVGAPETTRENTQPETPNPEGRDPTLAPDQNRQQQQTAAENKGEAKRNKEEAKRKQESPRVQRTKSGKPTLKESAKDYQQMMKDAPSDPNEAAGYYIALLLMWLMELLFRGGKKLHEKRMEHKDKVKDRAIDTMKQGIEKDKDKIAENEVTLDDLREREKELDGDIKRAQALEDNPPQDREFNEEEQQLIKDKADNITELSDNKQQQKALQHENNKLQRENEKRAIACQKIEARNDYISAQAELNRAMKRERHDGSQVEGPTIEKAKQKMQEAEDRSRQLDLDQKASKDAFKQREKDIEAGKGMAPQPDGQERKQNVLNQEQQELTQQKQDIENQLEQNEKDIKQQQILVDQGPGLGLKDDELEKEQQELQRLQADNERLLAQQQDINDQLEENERKQNREQDQNQNQDQNLNQDQNANPQQMSLENTVDAPPSPGQEQPQPQDQSQDNVVSATATEENRRESELSTPAPSDNDPSAIPPQPQDLQPQDNVAVGPGTEENKEESGLNAPNPSDNDTSSISPQPQGQQPQDNVAGGPGSEENEEKSEEELGSDEPGENLDKEPSPSTQSPSPTGSQTSSSPSQTSSPTDSQAPSSPTQTSSPTPSQSSSSPSQLQSSAPKPAASSSSGNGMDLNSMSDKLANLAQQLNQMSQVIDEMLKLGSSNNELGSEKHHLDQSRTVSPTMSGTPDNTGSMTPLLQNQRDQDDNGPKSWVKGNIPSRDTGQNMENDPGNEKSKSFGSRPGKP